MIIMNFWKFIHLSWLSTNLTSSLLKWCHVCKSDFWFCLCPAEERLPLPSSQWTAHVT